MPDGWRMTSGVATARMVDLDPELVRMVSMDPELEAFIPLFPPADLTDPVTARKHLAELAAAAPGPDTTRMEITDRTVPADPEVAVRIYRPHQAWPDRGPMASEPGPDGSSRRRSIDTACRGHTSQPRRSPRSRRQRSGPSTALGHQTG
jgi:hypothetical protein